MLEALHFGARRAATLTALIALCASGCTSDDGPVDGPGTGSSTGATGATTRVPATNTGVTGASTGGGTTTAAASTGAGTGGSAGETSSGGQVPTTTSGGGSGGTTAASGDGTSATAPGVDAGTTGTTGTTTGGGTGTTADAAVDDAGGTGGTDTSAPRPSAGCMGGSLSAGESTNTIEVGRNRREYIMTVPASYDGSEPYAVLLDFHGGTYNGRRWHDRASNKFPQMSDGDRFIYVTPTGLSAWWTTTDGVSGDDGMFMRALIDELKSTGCVDERRIYATGCSMGGDMSFYMGCYFSEDIAAVMPMCGSSAFDLENECKPTRPVSMQFVIGSRDSLNCWDPPRTSVGNPCATETQAVFKELNGCTGEVQSKHGDACESYTGCEEGTEVSICMFDATHTGIYQSTDIDIYRETWDFLSQFYIH